MVSSPTAKRNGYEPIPDIVTKPSTHSSPQEKYPEANELEAELLGLLDDVILEGRYTVHVELPVLQVQDVDISTTIWGFLCVLWLPTFLLLVTAGAALWVAMYATGPMLYFFPYAVALIGFLGTIPCTHRRLQHQATQIESLIKTTRPLAKDSIENVVLSVAQKVDSVRGRLNLVVDSMRPKFAAAHKASAGLKTMDPSMTIPDPTSIERELEGVKDEMNASIEFVEKSFPVTPWIPSYLQSSQEFYKRKAKFVFPICFVVPLVAVAVISLFCPIDDISELTAEEERVFFRGMWKRLRTMFRSKDDATPVFEDCVSLIVRAWPVPLVFIVVVYVICTLQILVVFLRTSASATAAIVNDIRSSVSDETNHLLRQHGIVFLCQDILEIRMGRVKTKLLEMITQLYKIDMLMSLASPPSPSRSSPSSSNSSPNRISPKLSPRRFWSSSKSPSP